MKSPTSIYELANQESVQNPRFVLAVDFETDIATTYPPINVTNLLPESERFDQAAWNKNVGGVITADDATAPDGTVTADRIDDQTTIDTVEMYDTATITGTNRHMVSIFVKKDAVTKTTAHRLLALYFSGSTTETGGIYFDSSTGEYQITTTGTIPNNLAGGVISHDDDWWRVWLAGEPADTANTVGWLLFSPARSSGATFPTGLVITPTVQANAHFPVAIGLSV